MATPLYFELEAFDSFHRRDWEEHLATWFAASQQPVQRVYRPDDAEFVVEPQANHSLLGEHVFRTAPQSHYRRLPTRTFAWDTDDLPSGRLPGLYASLGKQLFNARRHRSFCYPLRLNRLVVECPQSDARYLFGFSGTITSPLRARLFAELAPIAQRGIALLRETESLFMHVYDPAADVHRARFVDELRQCKFILCPRGNGFSSMRLFEAMEAGRVPVILSDAIMLPECVDWARCSIRVPENQLAELPALLASREADWPRLAAHARQEWLRCFAPATLLPTLVTQLRHVRAARARPENAPPVSFPVQVMPSFLVAHFKAQVRRIQEARLARARA